MTDAFLRECNRAVLAGMRAGLLTFPPPERDVERAPRRSTVSRPCAGCGVLIAIRSPWHQRCIECAAAHAAALKRQRRSASSSRKNA